MQTIRHQFVEFIPAEKVQGVLYVSVEYAMAVHLCPCGCGNVVAAPLDPHAWILTYNGETVSLWPSVGNWNLPCRSHYFIDQGTVRMAGRLSDRSIKAVKGRDKKTMMKGHSAGRKGSSSGRKR
jgi:hypothetical protein